ncbi:hypothetical protein IF655_05740 [Streptomyces sp. DSM 110735]|uniref:hypothetical protein n=1 Tax=Streptomyces sp. DSM 110735 TaxID=2775031 RepID=UPI0018F3D598|nr:hypothetical protein [Streptomyces sp. DSM 110735]MBJ7902797.1 hypothetical protein [Streptomyces sp. DSM 110735]
MGQRIIRQPDGRLVVFSSNTDSLIITDATAEEIVEWRAAEAAKEARRANRAELERVLDPDNPRPYRQLMLTWEGGISPEQEGRERLA